MTPLVQLIKRLLALIARALQNDPDNTAERDRLREEVKQLKLEQGELNALIPDINAAIEQASAAAPGEDPAPDEGNYNVRMSIVTDNREGGGEEMAKNVRSLNCSTAARNSFEGMFSAAVGAAKSAAEEPKQGRSWKSVARFSDGTSASQEVTLDSELQIAVFDAAFSQIANQAASEQASAIRSAE